MATMSEMNGRGRLPRSARRAQLMEAAQAVFVESGYHAAAMDEIAERAQVSKPVLYQHFPGKLDLYLALMDLHTAEMPAMIEEALQSTSDNQLRIAAALEAFFKFVEREDAGFRLVFESDLINERQVADRIERMSDELATSIAGVIREDTGLPDDRCQLLGVALVGMSQVVARYWLQHSETIPRDEATRLVGTLGWRGLAGFPKQESAESE